MSRRRVLLLLSEVFAHGGIQRFNRTLLAACEQLGIDCDVYTLADNEAARARWYRADGPLRIRTFARHKPMFAAAAVRAIATGTYDEVIIGHVHFLELAVSARLFRRRRPRMLLVAHGVEVWDRIRGTRRRHLAGVDRILCVSDYTAGSIRSQAPEIPAERFAIFPNALADLWVDKMGRLGADEAARTRAPFILSVARLSRHDRLKGIITTLEAFSQLADRSLRYVIAGDGDDREFLRRIASRLGVADRVDFPGAVSDQELVALYRECRAFVLPSGQEGFGIVFLEAMFFGAPVVAAREKGAIDVVRDGETGMLVAYGDVTALAAAITRVLTDHDLAARLRTAASANVTADGCFTATAFARRLGGLLEEQHAPRKLVFVNRYFHPDESATSRMVSDLACRLKRAGQQVAVVTSRQLYDDPAALLPEHAEVDGVIVHRVNTARRGRGTLAGRALDYLSFYIGAWWRLRKILNAGDVVIAKTDPPLLSLPVALAARARGAILVNWLQDVFPEVAQELGIAVRPAFLARVLLRLRDASLRRAACNVAIGARMAERLAARGIPASTIRVIPNWADTAEIAPQPTIGNPIRVTLGLDDRFVVGYSGNLGRAHEFETFLGAALLLRESSAFVFLVTGGGALLPALRQAVAAAGLDNFRFQPHQPAERLAASMAAADVHLVSLLPALEGLIVPSKYYGILAAGRPAIFIGDGDGELAREIRAADTGVVVAPGDSETLARELRRLHSDPELLARLGANARAQAVDRHGSQRALKSWLALLATLPEQTESGEPLLARAQSGT
ncbi:MAG: glycosyltransferase [Pseudomonadota bacterium]